MAGVQLQGKELLRVNVNGQPKNLVVLAGNDSVRLFEANPLVDAFNAQNGTNLRVVSHNVADVAFTVGETWKQLPACTVDASIAHEKPGTKIGEQIVFLAEGNPKVVQETGSFKGERNVALVAQGLTSADVAYKIEGKQRTLQEILQANGIEYLLGLDYRQVQEILQFATDRLVVVPDFQYSDGWRMPHAKTGVPHGKDVAASADARYLYGVNTTSYVGRLVRGGYFDGGQVVDAGSGASGRFGVVAEVPEGDVAKIETLLKPVEAPKTQAAAEKAVPEVPGVSIAQLEAMCKSAVGVIDGTNGLFDSPLLQPVRDFVVAMSKARF